MPVDEIVEAESGSSSYARYFVILWARLRTHYRLLIALIVVFLVLGFVYLLIARPSYTATATIGPPPMTLDQLTAGTGGGLGSSLVQGLGKRFGVSAGGAGGPFDEYQELLTTNRLAAVIVANPNLMHAIFYKNYDWSKDEWAKPTGFAHAVKTYLKQLINYPVVTQPGVDDVAKYLTDAVQVNTSLTSSFVTVSLNAEDPIKAQWILDSVLLYADQLIRKENLVDTEARIRYLTGVLPTVTQSDQQEQLSEILSQQEQTMMTLEADQRYASALVDPAHAPLIPTSPKITIVLATMIVLAVGIWSLLVIFLSADHWVLVFFGRKPRERFFEGRFAPGAVPTNPVGHSRPQEHQLNQN